MRPQEVLTIYINNAVRLRAAGQQAPPLLIYLAKLTGCRFSTFNFFIFFIFAFLCGNLSTTFHASQLDPTCSIFSRLFLCFSGLNAFDTQLGRTGRLAGFPPPPPASQPVVPSRGPPQNQLLTWHNLWPNHANFGIFFFCSVMESHDDERWRWVERGGGLNQI